MKEGYLVEPVPNKCSAVSYLMTFILPSPSASSSRWRLLFIIKIRFLGRVSIVNNRSIARFSPHPDHMIILDFKITTPSLTVNRSCQRIL
mmetsp:Transcript_35312/g.84358  ORF Transcript_35312/g.84358 Transcript_35312/m.84358 type:complete len:90 (+) Transcript_35312:103-372(+)